MDRTIEALSFTPAELAVAPTFAALWPSRTTAATPKVEWLVSNELGYYAEFNYTQIVRIAGRHEDYARKLREFLLELELCLLFGTRLNDTIHMQPCRTMGSLYSVGLDPDIAQLAFVQEPIKLVDEGSDKFSLMCEFTVRARAEEVDDTGEPVDEPFDRSCGLSFRNPNGIPFEDLK